MAPLLDAAAMAEDGRTEVRAAARRLVERLRAKPVRGGVQALVQEYSLSSEEGVALMCLAEALLRIPDNPTRDALIRDKLGSGDWSAHLGKGQSLFVDAATWGLVVTGKLTGDVDESGLSTTLKRLIARLGEPIIRQGVEIAMRLISEQFVAGRTIAEALGRAGPLERRGFTFSYDVLGEAALTAGDVARYYADYEAAIHAIGQASAGRGVHLGPGISVKLSALHPRYLRAQARRVMEELVPRVRKLALLAKSHDIGFNIDAEEADRLELSLDLLQSLAEDPALAGWNGLGFVVQAYGKRCPFVIDWIIDLARRTDRRIMLRLVKGAYWDAEIKRAQVDGLSGYPVFTRKAHTDVSYLACARKLLAARGAVFPQFATHNAQTVAAIHHFAGPRFAVGDWEFQCLHGMGEPLYDEVVGADKLGRPCRIYAPVGGHETLLAYLARRLLENGANSSFVNRIADPGVPVEALIADPVELVRAMATPGAPHEAIPLPAEIYGTRRNSAGLDLADETVLVDLSSALAESATTMWQAPPAISGFRAERRRRPVCNPADNRDTVGYAAWALPDDIEMAVRTSAAAAPGWAETPVETRCASLERAADRLQERMPVLIGLLIREAGKSAANAISEVREAIDFLRYYAAEARRVLTSDQHPLGAVVCISPWNFPLAIFTGQVAAALVAGNCVLAKPAEETPLVAAQAVEILHWAGIPEAVLQLLPGDGAIGGALVAAPQVAGVLFTGSTEAARAIQRQLAQRTAADGHPPQLVAETGGINAMVVDSSALPEQVVADVVTSAFDSAGQRCSALRMLCLQEDIAERTLAMLKGAMAELAVGPTEALDRDIGPIITAEAQANILRHIEVMHAAGHVVYQAPLGEGCAHGTFVAPTLIEIGTPDDLTREVFGPVLHVLRYPSDGLDELIDAIDAKGYSLTFGLHTRLDTTTARVMRRVRAGNRYINRNMIGAVVGVQPFGGNGLSGTGPKAGGPLYLGRLVRNPRSSLPAGIDGSAAFLWGGEIELSGPVGERNLYSLRPLGRIALCHRTEEGMRAQLAAVAGVGATGTEWSETALALPDLGAVLVENPADVPLVAQALAAREGAIVPLQLANAGGYVLDWLVEEVSTSINTTAAGGNASLMAVG